MEKCEDCKNQTGKGKHTPPHENLEQTKFVDWQVPRFGDVSEWHYKCKVCGHEWILEKNGVQTGWSG